eukprot:11331221-Alexandrium_andersonii.AAC.1
MCIRDRCLELHVQATSENAEQLQAFKTWNCAGPGTASESLPEAPEASTRRPGRHAGGVFAELLVQATPDIWKLLEQATPEIG